MSQVETDTTYRVQDIRNFTRDTFAIRMNRNGMEFYAGQHIVVGIKGDYNTREYSIYSGEQDPFLEILVKEVDEGYLSGKLGNLKPRDKLDVFGPMGYFTIDPNKINTHKFMLIGSGTGIAPFKSFVKTYKNLDYTILHGIYTEEEAFEREIYEPGRYISCTSRDQKGDFHGRVTDYLQLADFDENTLFYFCGNSEMIFDAMELLKGKGYSTDRMFTEVYF
jgi:ferredoxin--NADP+ reductase/benzoate/toluate 1,2-dioxygenase reductase subunit